MDIDVIILRDGTVSVLVTGGGTFTEAEQKVGAVLATLQANGIRLEQISAVERHRHTHDAVEQHTVTRKQST
jgi:hypothetical protein